MSLISELLGGAGTAYITQEGIEQARELPSQLGAMATDIASQVGTAAQFKPYTVTAGGATTRFTPEGYSQTLSPQQQAIARGLSGFGQAGIRGLGAIPNQRAISGIASQALGGVGGALGADTGATARALGNMYGTLGATQIEQGQTAPSLLTGLQQAASTQALQMPTGASQGLTGLTGLMSQANFGNIPTDVTGAYSGVVSPDVRTGAGQLAGQALSQANLGARAQDVTGAFAGIQAPTTRTGAGEFSGGLLSRAMQGLDADTPTAQSVFDQIRAMQSPEEERQRIALENRLAAQGRLGVQTAQYGGTPEQLALEKAQAEARNQASLQALQTADQLASSQQARATQLGQMGLSGEQIQAQLDAEGFGQQMQLGQARLQEAQTQESLQSSVQQRQAQLAQLGLSAEQIQAQMDAEGFGRDMSLAGAGIQAQQAQSALQSEAQQRASQLAQLGMSAEQIASQLESEGLRRSQSSAQLAGQLAQTEAGIRAQEQQLGQSMLGLGLQAQELGGQLGMQDLQRASTMLGLGQQAQLMPSQLDSARLANIVQSLQASGIPQQQAIEALAPALTGLSMIQRPAELQAQALANLGQQQLAGVPSAINAEALLRQAQLEGLTNVLGLGASGGQQNVSGGNVVNSAVGNLLGSLGGSIGGFLGGLFSGDSSSSAVDDASSYITNFGSGSNALDVFGSGTPDIGNTGMFSLGTGTTPFDVTSFVGDAGVYDPDADPFAGLGGGGI